MQDHVREILRKQNPGWDNPSLAFQPHDHDELYEGTSIPRTPPLGSPTFYDRELPLFRDEAREPYRTIGGVVGAVMWGFAIAFMLAFTVALVGWPLLVIWDALT